ncbi:coiled-coil domain-containing protein 28B isoform X3 [Apteryx mantelli]|uniref:Coiled-coil domain-containing protein 28B isoform X3 n=1 Tax=Apteryx mantelli TaxID=2696672 RepID=A0ABM4FS61_9AVES
MLWAARTRSVRQCHRLGDRRQWEEVPFPFKCKSQPGPAAGTRCPAGSGTQPGWHRTPGTAAWRRVSPLLPPNPWPAPRWTTRRRSRAPRRAWRPPGRCGSCRCPPARAPPSRCRCPTCPCPSSGPSSGGQCQPGGVGGSPPRPPRGPSGARARRCHVCFPPRRTSKEKAQVAPAGGSAGAPLGALLQHSFLTDVSDVCEMEGGLLNLLNDFHSGKECSFEQLEHVREMQEKLARLHFSLDVYVEELSEEQKKTVADRNLDQLLTNVSTTSSSSSSSCSPRCAAWSCSGFGHGRSVPAGVLAALLLPSLQLEELSNSMYPRAGRREGGRGQRWGPRGRAFP